MSKRYSINGQALNTADTTALLLISTTTIRPRINDLIMGSSATPADNSGRYVLQRTTASGSGTPVTPQALDPDDPLAAASSFMANTVEPTYSGTQILLSWSQNQRATFRWVASPGGELVLPATANNGLGIRTISIGGSAVIMDACMHYEE